MPVPVLSIPHRSTPPPFLRYTFYRRLFVISVKSVQSPSLSCGAASARGRLLLKPETHNLKPLLLLLLTALLLALLAACTKFSGPKVIESGYVTANQVYLRDRLSEIYRKAGVLKNGEKIDVLEKSRRFARVRNAAGVIGWIEQRSYITQDVYDQFQKLNKDAQALPVASVGVVHSETNLHFAPGRDSDHLYQLAPNSRIEILKRVVAEKTTAAPAPPPRKKPAQNGKYDKSGAKPNLQNTPPQNMPAPPVPAIMPAAPAVAAANATPPILEDWWLVRDSSGHAGWILGRAIDLDVPLDILQYAEGRRIIFAGILNTVQDDEMQRRAQESAAAAGAATNSSASASAGPGGSNTPTVGKDGRVAQYVVLFTEAKDGQPFDFNSIRVFTWNTRKHRYENAYRERDIFGLLPASVGTQNFGKDGTLPVFTFHIAGGDGKPVERKYRMNGVMVSRVLSPEEQAAKDADKAAKKVAAPARNSGKSARPTNKAEAKHHAHRKHKH